MSATKRYTRVVQMSAQYVRCLVWSVLEAVSAASELLTADCER